MPDAFSVAVWSAYKERKKERETSINEKCKRFAVFIEEECNRSAISKWGHYAAV